MSANMKAMDYAFEQAMAGKHYGRDERSDACGWFRTGWMAAQPAVQPYSAYHEDDGTALWWMFPICEAPYVGRPGDSDWPFEDAEDRNLWWTPLSAPELPASVYGLVSR